MKSLGIDLASKEKNSTGFAILEESRIETLILNRDEEIIERCESESPEIIAVDAPLSIPEGNNLRESDSELIGMGYRVLPPTLGGMKDLTERGIELSNELRGHGFSVIEVHPRTSGKILFDSDSEESWIPALKKRGWQLDADLSDHELDSALAAITGAMHEREMTEKVGGEGGGIVIPSSPLPSP